MFKLLLSDKNGNILNPEKIRTNEWLKNFRSPKFILGFERRQPEKFASCLKQKDGDKYIFHDLIESSQNLSEQGYRRILPGIKLDNTQKQQFQNILKNMNVGNSKKVEKNDRYAPDEKI